MENGRCESALFWIRLVGVGVCLSVSVCVCVCVLKERHFLGVQLHD